MTVALRLFLPESWTSDRARLKRAGVPAEHRTARTKPEIALAEISHMIAAGVRFGCVLADAGYGLSAPFRQGLTARSLAWAVGIPRHLKVYPVGVRLIWPIAGRPRQRHVPNILSMAAEDMLADARWQNISWRTGTKGKAQSPLCGCACAHGRRTTAADQGQGSATSAGGRGLAHRRMRGKVPEGNEATRFNAGRCGRKRTKAGRAEPSLTPLSGCRLAGRGCRQDQV